MRLFFHFTRKSRIVVTGLVRLLPQVYLFLARYFLLLRLNFDFFHSNDPLLFPLLSVGCPDKEFTPVGKFGQLAFVGRGVEPMC